MSLPQNPRFAPCPDANLTQFCHLWRETRREIFRLRTLALLVFNRAEPRQCIQTTIDSSPSANRLTRGMAEQLFHMTFNTQPLEDWLVRELKEEFKQQGHVLSGKLLASIRTKAEQFISGDAVIEVSMLDRYVFTERGVRASRVPFGTRRSRGARGGTSQYIQGLVDFVLLRKITTNPKKALGIAFAIAHTQKKQGQPTRGSYAYSNNGRRLRFQRTVLKGKAFKSETRSEWGEQLQFALDRAIIKLNQIAA